MNFEYICNTLNDLATHIEQLAIRERESIGDKTPKQSALLKRERASTYENIAHMIRHTKLRNPQPCS